MFLGVLNEVIEKCNEEEYIFIGGDFNCTAGQQVRKKPCRPSHCLSHSSASSHGGSGVV